MNCLIRKVNNMSEIIGSEMKNSDIEWVGEIPFDWDVIPASGVFVEIKEKNVNNQHRNPFSFKYGEIVDKKITGGIDDAVLETLSTYRVVSRNTIMINGLNLNYDFITQRVAIVKETGIITSAYLAVQPDEKRIYPRFVLYLLKSYDNKQVFHAIGSGVRKTLKFQDFKNIKIVAPDIDKQKAIADYLDVFSRKIGEIIEEAKKSKEEYSKWKAAIIFEAVTKGIIPGRLFKDSGVLWIGNTPDEWSTASLKYLCSMQSGKNLTSEQISTNGKYTVYGGNGQRGYYNEYNRDGEYLLVGRQGALCGNVHKVSGQFWATEHAVVTENTKRADLNFLYYLLVGMNLNQYSSDTAAQPGLSVGNILNVKTCLPPLKEQKQIASYLVSKCIKIDELISEKQALIDDLELYKKAHIFEAVTGKRKVV